MKRFIFALFTSIVLLCSCEKFSGHYTYETTVPNTTIKESLLGKVISLDDFLSVTNGVRYEHVRSYACRRTDGKVYYSHEIGDVIGGIYSLQYQFYPNYLEKYIFSDALRKEVTLKNYTYDQESMRLTDMYHMDINENIENKLLYADKEYLIFETKGIVDGDIYYTKGAEFSRVVYRCVEGNELIVPADTIAFP